MSVSVYIPTPFRRATAGAERVEIDAPDVTHLLDALERRFEGFRGLVRDDAGQIHHHVNLYVNGEEIGSLQGQATRLAPGDEVSIIPALAGGA
jgi:molybdopterin converting factor small subunit